MICISQKFLTIVHMILIDFNISVFKFISNNLIIDDGNDSIRTTFMGEKAEKLIGVETDKLVQIRETPDFEKFLEKKSSEFLGKDIVIKGKAKFSDYSSSFEISVFDFKYLDIDEELERAMKIIET